MTRTGAPLLTGAVAGPLLLLVVLLAGTVRTGYDRVRHGVSQLGTGEPGWPVQAAFVVCGALFAVFALVIGGRNRDAVPAPWVTRWFGVLALGLVLAGVAPTDPALGFPPGATEPPVMTTAAIVHQAGGALMFAGLIGAGIAAGRWFGRTGNRGWARVSLASAIIVAGAAVAAGIAYRLIQRGIVATGPAGLLELVSFLVGFAWTTAFAVRLIRRPEPAAVSGRAAAEPS